MVDFRSLDTLSMKYKKILIKSTVTDKLVGTIMSTISAEIQQYKKPKLPENCEQKFHSFKLYGIQSKA